MGLEVMQFCGGECTTIVILVSARDLNFGLGLGLGPGRDNLQIFYLSIS